VETLGRFLIQQPLHIAGVAAVFFLLWAVARPRSKVLLVAALAWTGYAGWEWLVLARTPEADIHVDLLLIWPVLAILSIWSDFDLLRTFRKQYRCSG
jgi:hypothetical protein